MSQNIIQKIWDSHVVHSERHAPDVLFIDLHLIHEVTSPQAFSSLREKNLTVFDPSRVFATLDHSIPTDDARQNFASQQSRDQVDALQKNCEDFGIEIFRPGSGQQGIVHIIGPELGLTLPGRTIVCGDSHTSTHGAFGALAFGIGTSQVLHTLATGALLAEKPKTMQVLFSGTPTKYFSAKDAILALIRQIGVQGGTGFAIEFCGEFIRNLSMEARMTLCNMSIECGARFGLISPDQKTFDFLQKCPRAPQGKDFAKAVQKWKNLASAPDAHYDKVVKVQLDDRRPIVTWGTSPDQSLDISESVPRPEKIQDPARRDAAISALKYTGLQAGAKIAGTKIDLVFVGSCTNGRIEDFRKVAEILRGQSVHSRVKCVLVPGSEKVREQIFAEKLDQVFAAAGAELRQPGCSMCLAMNGDKVPPGKRAASTSNRNFIGRQGPGSRTHLMSPQMAAIAAITGEITDPEKFFESQK